jgi:hypothetical protein
MSMIPSPMKKKLTREIKSIIKRRKNGNRNYTRKI